MTRAQRQVWSRVQVVVMTPLVVGAYVISGAVVGFVLGIFGGAAAAFAEVRQEWRRA
ncbi:MAG: hypothetical protein AB7O67_23645 [Vicinamibacterales bacterium]